MRRHRKFPLFSAVLVVMIAAGVAYQAFLDVDLLSGGVRHLGRAASGLLSSMRLTRSADATEGFVFSDSGDPGDPMPMLVSEKSPLPGDFRPQHLVLMRDYCDSTIVKIKGSEIEGEKEAVDALMQMLHAAVNSGVTNWQISAGYRSIGYQQQLWDDRAYTHRQQGLSEAEAQSATAQYVALPGASEHHTGLAFDVTVPGQSFPLTEQAKWLNANCWEFGFIIRYTEEKKNITGISGEPWHIRYVGQPHARIMRDNNWCLEEYIQQNGN